MLSLSLMDILARLVILLTVLSRVASAAERELGEFIAAPGTLAITVYQRWLSPAKGTSCPMTPSDSAFARQAVRKNGILLGSLQSFDRLNRCGHDLSTYPLVETRSGLRYSDPVR